MFNKDKGIVWLLVNAVLILSLIGVSVSLLVTLVNGLLPQDGDYTSFVFSDFMYKVLCLLFSAVLFALALYLINKLVNLFDDSYALSRKFLNFIFLQTAIGSLIYIFCNVAGVVFGVFLETFIIKEIIALMMISALGLYLINFKPIMVKENSIIQNFINFVSVQSCVYSLYAFIISILNFKSFTHPVNFVRTVLVEIVIFAVFAFVIYWINFKNKLKESPEAFNVNKE